MVGPAAFARSLVTLEEFRDFLSKDPKSTYAENGPVGSKTTISFVDSTKSFVYNPLLFG